MFNVLAENEGDEDFTRRTSNGIDVASLAHENVFVTRTSDDFESTTCFLCGTNLRVGESQPCDKCLEEATTLPYRQFAKSVETRYRLVNGNPPGSVMQSIDRMWAEKWVAAANAAVAAAETPLE